MRIGLVQRQLMLKSKMDVNLLEPHGSSCCNTSKHRSKWTAFNELGNDKKLFQFGAVLSGEHTKIP
jgi:hypothetical protein